MRDRASVAIALSDEERGFLQAQLRRHKAARSLSDRCRIVLRCADGLTSKEIAAKLGHSEHTVGKWRRRFARHRNEGLSDEYRAGRPRTVSDEQVADVIKRTLETTPKDATHWPIQSMADEIGPSHTTIRRIHCPAGYFRRKCPERVERLWAAAAPRGNLQVVHRPAVRGQGAGHCRPLHVATEPC